jgi:hypothetical protein
MPSGARELGSAFRSFDGGGVERLSLESTERPVVRQASAS